jgi:hypothetical protein
LSASHKIFRGRVKPILKLGLRHGASRMRRCTGACAALFCEALALDSGGALTLGAGGSGGGAILAGLHPCTDGIDVRLKLGLAFVWRQWSRVLVESRRSAGRDRHADSSDMLA